MTNENAKRLMLIVEAYACGEVPSALELSHAPRLEEWKAVVRQRGKAFVLVARGNVHNHPEYRDGEFIQTSEIVWFDRRSRFVRTLNTLYVLGEQAGDDIPLEGIDG